MSLYTKISTMPNCAVKQAECLNSFEAVKSGYESKYRCAQLKPKASELEGVVKQCKFDGILDGQGNAQ